jgi:hypothetical protein
MAAGRLKMISRWPSTSSTVPELRNISSPQTSSRLREALARSSVTGISPLWRGGTGGVTPLHSLWTRSGPKAWPTGIICSVLMFTRGGSVAHQCTASATSSGVSGSAPA